MEPQPRLTEVVDAILRYLHSHPEAADTVDGICEWWLPTHWRVDRQRVEAALGRMEVQGLVRRRENADHHVLYSRADGWPECSSGRR
ncbi:helix-turn-helix domain-containing protein [Accumulibacter sp.]|uniref:MarR family transcriptional regulator n=1 Tax=Accumulibacter sp. TaxID=2053492 RepID=UPI00260B9E68|nr:helix-turn-helix domain-containing protein [Accumulibacter sp.]